MAPHLQIIDATATFRGIAIRARQGRAEFQRNTTEAVKFCLPNNPFNLFTREALKQHSRAFRVARLISVDHKR